MRKSARQYHGIKSSQGVVTVPDDRRVRAEAVESFDDVLLAVGPRELPHPDPHGHGAGSNVTAESSITGLVSRRRHSWSTSVRADSSSAASSTKRNALP